MNTNLEEIIKVNSYKIFNVENKLYMINGINFSIFEVDELIKEILNNDGLSKKEIYNKLEKKCNWDEFDKSMKQLEEKKIISTKQAMDYQQNNHHFKFKGDSIILMMAQECNLRCVYCYGEAGEYSNKGVMPIETAKKAVEYIFSKSDSDDITITFFGGEPLIRFKEIKQLVAYSKELAKIKGKYVRFAITTNGTLLTEEISEFLMENKFSITISIDGNEEVTNKNRFFANYKGAYNYIINNTKKLRKEYRTTARGTITGAGLDLLNNFNHLIDLDFSKVILSCSVNMLCEEDYKVVLAGFKECIKVLFELIQQGEYKKAQKMGNLYTILERIHMGGYRSKGCGAGDNMICVDIDGEMYPCHRFVGDKEYAFGTINNMDEDKLDEILSQMQINANVQCKSCWARSICGGGCVNENAVINKQTNIPYKNTCDLYKVMIELCVEGYLRLSEKQKDELFSHIKLTQKVN